MGQGEALRHGTRDDHELSKFRKPLRMERYFGPITDRNMHHGAESTRCGQIDVARRATDLKSKWRRENGLAGRKGRGGALQFAMRLLASFRSASSAAETDWRSKFAIDLCLGSGFGVSPFGEGFLQLSKCALQVRS